MQAPLAIDANRHRRQSRLRLPQGLGARVSPRCVGTRRLHFSTLPSSFCIRCEGVVHGPSPIVLAGGGGRRGRGRATSWSLFECAIEALPVGFGTEMRQAGESLREGNWRLFVGRLIWNVCEDNSTVCMALVA